MNAIKKFKVPIMVIAALILAFVIYSYFKGDSTQDSALLTSDAPANPESAAVGQAFLNQLLTLQDVRLDDSVFSDPRFKSLVDDSQPIPDEPQGRPNPFAPIGVDQNNSPTIGGSNGSNYNFTFDNSSTTPPRSGASTTRP